jgi:hypothetical protein
MRTVVEIVKVIFSPVILLCQFLEVQGMTTRLCQHVDDISVGFFTVWVMDDSLI